MPEPTLAERVHGSPGLRRRRAVGRRLGEALADLDVVGLRHLPTTGPVLLAANHRAFLDGPLLFGLVPRPVTFLVKAEAFTRPQVARVLRDAGQVPVVRGAVDPAPVRLVRAVLDGGGVVGLFPEGTRGDGLARTAEAGVGWLALRTGAVVVPVALHGTAALGRRGRTRPPVRVTFGEPLPPPDVGRWNANLPLPRRVFRAEAERVRVALADLVARTAPRTPGGQTAERRTP